LKGEINVKTQVLFYFFFYSGTNHIS